MQPSEQQTILTWAVDWACAATGMAFSFATTYALGQLARRYYASGRQMSAALLQSTYQSLLGEAKQLQQQNLAQIRDKARTLDTAQAYVRDSSIALSPPPSHVALANGSGRLCTPSPIPPERLDVDPA
jgi:hypothetical protein